MTGEGIVRAAVVGVGYLGKFHAEKYAAEKGVKLVAVVDVDHERCREVAEATGARALRDVGDLAGTIDCASIAVPTPLHHPIAEELLEAGVDVLVEKPLASSIQEARALVERAAALDRILQVGHLERFNPAIRELAGILKEPRFLECHRLATFNDRGTDVDVILDLMIHDLDIILSLVPAEVRSVEAVGVPVLTGSTDIANARLRFANGTIANVTASRVSLKRERKLRIFQHDTYISVDYDERRMRICRRTPPKKDTPAEISVEERTMERQDPLREEIRAFLDSVRTREKPIVSGAEGLAAMNLADEILRSVAVELAGRASFD